MFTDYDDGGVKGGRGQIEAAFQFYGTAAKTLQYVTNASILMKIVRALAFLKAE